jgi:hypothetical protein
MEAIAGVALVAGWIWLSLACGLIMESKGRSALVGTLLGLFFPFWGVIISLALPPAHPLHRQTP